MEGSNRPYLGKFETGSTVHNCLSNQWDDCQLSQPISELRKCPKCSLGWYQNGEESNVSISPKYNSINNVAWCKYYHLPPHWKWEVCLVIRNKVDTRLCCDVFILSIMDKVYETFTFHWTSLQNKSKWNTFSKYICQRFKKIFTELLQYSMWLP